MKTLPVQPHRGWLLSSQQSLGTRGSARLVLGQGVDGGIRKVTPEATLYLGISAWDPTERQECGPELAEGHPEGWPGLCLAAHKCPGGMGCRGGVGELPVCQQQPRLTGCCRGGSRNACKPATKGSLPGSSAGSRRREWGSTQDRWPLGGQLCSSQAQRLQALCCGCSPGWDGPTPPPHSLSPLCPPSWAPGENEL